MESSSTLQKMPWFKNLRSGQRETVELFSQKQKVITQLPTGYGKTLAAAASYVQCKEQWGVNRVLYVAPKAGQVKQAAEEFPLAIYNLSGNKLKSHVIGDNPITALKAHRGQKSEIFITTIQAISSKRQNGENGVAYTALQEMMATGRWMIVIDEHHHYGDSEDSVWTEKVLSLPASVILAMSATPSRTDGKSPIGEPNVVVMYVDALKEKAVKRLSLHSYEYRVDAITINGEVIPFTTDELFREVGSSDAADIDKFMASKQMKWSPKYISPLVLHPLERLNNLYLQKGIKGQMLVQAMSCSHAKMVCEQIKAIIPTGINVDWCGTGPNGRTDEENDDVINRFCPPKDLVTNKRKWSLDILVNVGIASKGLDTNDVCEIVFLTSPKKNNTNLQITGRGARLHQYAPIDDQPTCTINVDSSSELNTYVGAKIMEIFDDGKISIDDNEKEEREKGEKEYNELPDDIPQVGVLDVTLVDIHTDPMFIGVLELTTKALEKSSLSKEDKDILVTAEVERQVRRFMAQRDERFNASAIEAQSREKIDRAVRHVAGLLVKKATSAGISIEKSMIGDLFRRINSQKKRALGPIESATKEDLDKHWHWVKQLETQILNGKAPQWVR